VIVGHDVVAARRDVAIRLVGGGRVIEVCMVVRGVVGLRGAVGVGRGGFGLCVVGRDVVRLLVVGRGVFGIFGVRRGVLGLGLFVLVVCLDA
jgi:hypothetical protein